MMGYNGGFQKGYIWSFFFFVIICFLLIVDFFVNIKEFFDYFLLIQVFFKKIVYSDNFLEKQVMEINLFSLYVDVNNYKFCLLKD